MKRLKYDCQKKRTNTVNVNAYKKQSGDVLDKLMPHHGNSE